MQTPTRRDWKTPIDRLGPKTKANVRLTRRGIGGVYALLGNPISVTVDPVLGCVPWLSLRGGTDPASESARNAVLADPNLQASVNQPAADNPYTLQTTPASSSSSSADTPRVIDRSPGGGSYLSFLRRVPGR